MKFVVTKTCQGVVDTDVERRRIMTAFRHDPQIRKRLLKLLAAVEAVEAQDWQGAWRQLQSPWWDRDDPREGVPRREFLGFLGAHEVGHPDRSARGLDDTTYATLITHMVARPRCVLYNIEPLEEAT